jgi:cytochrome c-type biogenesis protein CcmE
VRRRRVKYLVGGVIVLGALLGLIYSGVKQSVVYFYTPSEVLKAQGQVGGKSLRLGGMVEDGSIRWDPQTLLLTFKLTDGQGAVLVRHKGTAPDLFKEGAGAVVEGSWMPEGYFRASTIMAKHSEEYKPPTHPETLAAKKEMFKSMIKEGKP